MAKMNRLEKEVYKIFSGDKEIVKLAKEINDTKDVNKFEKLVSIVSKNKKVQKMEMNPEEIALIILDLVDKGILKEKFSYVEYFVNVLSEQSQEDENEEEEEEMNLEVFLEDLNYLLENADTDLEVALIEFIKEMAYDEIIPEEWMERFYEILEEVAEETNEELVGGKEEENENI